LHLRTNGSERYFAACATTHIPQVQLDRVLFCELNHRADEMVAIEANTSDTLFTRIDRNAIEKDHSKITFRLNLSYLRRHRLSRSRMGTFQCRTTKKCAPRPPHASRPPSRAAFPPASTSRPFSLLSDSTSRLHCAKPTAPAHLGENDHDGPHVSAANLVVITTDTAPMISSAGGAGRLA
jgi:hypothetical protein